MALHWLPVWERIEYKILTLVYKYTVGEAPAYLMDMIQERDIHQEGVRSNRDHKSLGGPTNKKTNICLKIIFICRPNVVEPFTKHHNTLDVFKTKLKTHLFRCAFN